LLEKHFLLLQHWNRTLNLTSLKNPEEIVERHYAESLFLGAHLPAGNLSIVDVGSGAGFPGIPVARPSNAVVRQRVRIDILLGGHPAAYLIKLLIPRPK
jgi:16S rRNA G527 N7-methylase RsmG